jgi:RNA polymerase sigma factor (sigma-70 family)
MADPGTSGRPEHLTPVPTPARVPDAGALLKAVARGEEKAFGELYDLVAPRVYGLIRRVLRDPAQAEEVAQEALIEVWRSAARFDPDRGSATAWIFTIAHRRAVDRVRTEQAAADRTIKVGAASIDTPYDEVADEGRGPAGAPPGAELPGRPDRVAAPGGHPRLLPGPHLPAGVRAARSAARNGEDQDAGRPDQAAGLPFDGGDGMTADAHTLLGAYVLDAVDDIDRAAFGRHLNECEECRAEVAELA